jgi:ribonuclease HI
MLEWIARLKPAELELVMTALYQIWHTRNDARDELIIEDPQRTARRIMFLLEEWRAVTGSVKTPGVKEKVRWRPPEAAWHKVNADGAWTAEGNAGGSGVIVRDHNGRALACACDFFPTAKDPETAELLACRRALLLARDMNVERVVLETDCMGAVNKLKDKGLDRSAQGHLVEEIKKLLKGFMMASVSHVHRSGNEVAHSLAQDGCKNKLCKTWLGQVPDYVGARVTAEAEF